MLRSRRLLPCATINCLAANRSFAIGGSRVVVWQHLSWSRLHGSVRSLLSYQPQKANARIWMCSRNLRELRFLATKTKGGTKKKKKGKEKKVIPPLLSIDEEREKMERRFAVIEQEDFGPNRGVRTVKTIAGKNGENLHKSITTRMANSILNDWIYTRHALKHGFRHINKMNRKTLSCSLIRDGTTVKILETDARTCLKESFRYGKSAALDRYVELDRKRVLVTSTCEKNRQRNAARREAGNYTKIQDLADRKAMEDEGYTEDRIRKELSKRVRFATRRAKRSLQRKAKAMLGETSDAKSVSVASSKAIVEETSNDQPSSYQA